MSFFCFLIDDGTSTAETGPLLAREKKSDFFLYWAFFFVFYRACRGRWTAFGRWVRPAERKRSGGSIPRTERFVRSRCSQPCRSAVIGVLIFSRRPLITCTSRIPGHGPGRAWAGSKKAHGRKLRPRPYHQAYFSSPSPAHLVKSLEKPLGLRAVGRASSLKCQYAKPKPVQALLVGSKLRPKPGPRASPSGLGPGFLGRAWVGRQGRAGDGQV